MAGVRSGFTGRSKRMMKRTLAVVTVLLLSFACTATAQEKAKPKSDAASIEANVRKLWESFKNKDKATLSGLLDDGFRQFEEGLTAFGDKKAEVNGPDEYDLLNYALSDFNVKATGPNSVVVTYIAQYEGKTGGEVTKAKSVFGEVWIRSGSQWKALYMQETYMK
jgi:hypothetical protein